MIFGPWAEILRTGKFLHSRIEAALRAKGLPNLVWYDVLAELAGAHPDGLRSFELVERLMLKQYTLSRLLGRMESDGVLHKHQFEADGRGFLLVISENGLRQKQAMQEVYAGILRQKIGDRLTISEAENLVTILQKLRD